MVKLICVKTKRDIERIKQLFLEYVDTLGFDLHFQNFKQELRNLPGAYASPEGCMMLALDDDEAVGCVALRPLSAGICEMKRLYVKPRCRGKKIGKMLANAIVAEALRCGYERMRLDTVPSMKEARRLYESMGFKQTPAYRHNPVPGALYFELELNQTRLEGSPT
jgi:ribosomal protein S18 acetylase RimI-like enzyme